MSTLQGAFLRCAASLVPLPLLDWLQPEPGGWRLLAGCRRGSRCAYSRPPLSPPLPTEPGTPLPLPATPTMADPLPARADPDPLPAMADPVTASPAMADPFTASPTMADPFTASPAMADPFTASPTMADPVTASPTMADPFTASPAMADPDPLPVSLTMADPQPQADPDTHSSGPPTLLPGAAPSCSRVKIRVVVEEEPEPHPLPVGSGSDEEPARHEKSSGAENEGDELESDWKAPDSELIQKLVTQIEYYLSDENLEKDAFLLKHVRRNKMGYVSVKLLTSFKKVKHLTRDWRTTAHALKLSETLELNEEGRKVRRKVAVPVFPSENLPSRMLLVYDMQKCPELQVLNHNTEPENSGLQERIMEYLLKIFGLFGTISSVRILKPGKDLPPDVRRLSNRYSQLGTKESVIVEFEDVEAAIEAHESLGKPTGDDGMKVVLIGMKPPKKKVVRDKEDIGKVSSKNKSLNKRVEELQFGAEDSSACSSSEPDSNPTSPMLGRKLKPNNKLSPNIYNNHLSPNASPRSSPWNSPRSSPSVQRKNPLAWKSPLTTDTKLSPSTSPDLGRNWVDYSSDSSTPPCGSPWVQRRRQAQAVSHENSPTGSPMLSRKILNAGGLPPGVVRLPRGPDGTKGFQIGSERGKPLVI